jgi:hypothetical protein
MYSIIREKTVKDKQLPDRYYDLFIYQKILEGTLYDCFEYGYYQQYVGKSAVRYIEEINRAPSTNTGLNLMRSVVEESTSFMFGEDRFPSILTEDQNVQQWCEDVIQDSHLVYLMQDAAYKGAIGSVAIQIRVLNNRFFPLAHWTTFLTPQFDPLDPQKLIKLTEKYKLQGRDLLNAGYQIDKLAMNKWFWFQRIWDNDAETWFEPWEVTHDENYRPRIDPTRSVQHNLGFVPFVWIKNLPGGNQIDGLCTFEPAIENAVQIDYLMSRSDAALKYASDPLMVFKVRNPSQVADFVRAEGNALVLGVEGDAKVLEITGDAAHAIIDTVKELKDEALHSIHSNRADPSKIATSHSSVVQRFLYLPTVQLASTLRESYCEIGIRQLLNMMLMIANKVPIIVKGKRTNMSATNVSFELIYPDWFPATPFDQQTESATIVALVQGGLMSKKEALRQLNKFFKYEDIDAELGEIEQDQEKLLANQLKLAQAGQSPQKGSNSPATSTNVRTQ